MADQAGIYFGLQILISNYTDLNLSNFGSKGLGVVVFVHNKSLSTKELEEGIYIKPGELSFIGIKRTFIKNTPSPYTQCQDLTSYSSELYDYIKKSNQIYRQRDCFDLCTQKLIISTCGCIVSDYENSDLNSNQIRPCLDLNDSNCADNAYFQVDFVKCASDYCPLECDSIQYDLTASSLILPFQANYEEKRLQYINFFVFYSQLDYTLIQENPAMSLANLIANIGGTMGVIISVSFFTLLEIAELLVLILHEWFVIQKTSNKISF